MNATNDTMDNETTTTGATRYLDELRALIERAARMAREEEKDDDPFFVSRVFNLNAWGDDGTIAFK